MLGRQRDAKLVVQAWLESNQNIPAVCAKKDSNSRSYVWNVKEIILFLVLSNNAFSFKSSVRKIDLSRYSIVPSIIC